MMPRLYFFSAAETLGKPLVLPRGTTIKNRFFKSAMSEIMAEEHRPTAKLLRLYQTWTRGGTGLVITGNVMIDSRALGEPANVVLENDKNLKLFQRLR